MSMFTKYEQHFHRNFKTKETQNFFSYIYVQHYKLLKDLAYTSNENHVIIIELSTSPNGPVWSSFSGAMFGVASTKEIGTL